MATPPKASPTSRVSPSSAASPTARTSPTLAPLVMTPPAFHVGEVRIVYSDVVLTASGGKAPYSWAVSSGALPGGLTLSTGGTVSGTPTAAGGFSFGVQVSDSAGGNASTGGSINIAQYLSGGGTCTVSCPVEAGCVTVCGTYAKPIGGVAPFKYSSPGPLPPGTTLGFPALTGQFTGTGSYPFTVTVVDSLGAATKIGVVFDVFPHIWVKAGSMPTGYIKIPYSTSIPYGGGSGVPKVTLVKGALPPGLTAAVDSRSGLLVISGVPSAIGTYNFILKLTDTSPCGVGYNCWVNTPTLSIVIQLG
ncbi:MAG TPA: putative Ig domain-containing protein [Candidatus Dormibacteraeota bacterium]